MNRIMLYELHEHVDGSLFVTHFLVTDHPTQWRQWFYQPDEPGLGGRFAVIAKDDWRYATSLADLQMQARQHYQRAIAWRQRQIAEIEARQALLANLEQDVRPAYDWLTGRLTVSQA